MTHTKKFVYKDMGIRPKNSREFSYPDEMLQLLQIKYRSMNTQSPECRKRICEVFGFVVKMGLKYLPPKQRTVFYSVWIRSGGKMKEGVMEYSRKTNKNYVTSYGNYYKSIHNLKNILAKAGFDKLIEKHLEEVRDVHEN
jgi:hypothetical protein